MSQPIDVRPITSGPRYHWFGYYDKLQFDPANRHVLGMEVDFEDRSPQPDDVIEIGMVDLADGDRWIELGETRAWCWQQGCMLQWRPGSDNEVIWNDREGDRFVCHILDVETGEKRTLPMPVYTLSPDGRRAVTPDFRRINDMRPGYGYAGLPDPHADELAPAHGRHLPARPGDRRRRADRLAGRDRGDPVSARRPVRGQALLQPPALQPGRQPLQVPAPLALRRRPVRHAHVHRRGRRLRRARGRRLRPHVALHLARPAAHPGLVVAPVARRRFYLFEDQDAAGARRRGRGAGRDDAERPLHLPAGATTSGSSTTAIRARTGCASSISTMCRRAAR